MLYIRQYGWWYIEIGFRKINIVDYKRSDNIVKRFYKQVLNDIPVHLLSVKTLYNAYILS